MMKGKRLTRIGRIFVEGTLVDQAVEAAARDALALHEQAEVPVVLYRNGKVVTVSAKSVVSARKAGRGRSRRSRAAARGARA